MRKYWIVLAAFVALAIGQNSVRADYVGHGTPTWTVLAGKYNDLSSLWSERSPSKFRVWFDGNTAADYHVANKLGKTLLNRNEALTKTIDFANRPDRREWRTTYQLESVNLTGQTIVAKVVETQTRANGRANNKHTTSIHQTSQDTWVNVNGKWLWKEHRYL